MCVLFLKYVLGRVPSLNTFSMCQITHNTEWCSVLFGDSVLCTQFNCQYTQYQAIIRGCTIFPPTHALPLLRSIQSFMPLSKLCTYFHFSFCSFLLSLLFPICLVNNLGETKKGTPEILPVCNKFCFMTSCCF